MAHFRGFMQGMRGQASRLGSKNSGLVAQLNGWGGGVSIHLYVNADGLDCAFILLNGGSNDAGPSVTLYDGPLTANTRSVLASGKWVGTGLQTKTHREGLLT